MWLWLIAALCLVLGIYGGAGWWFALRRMFDEAHFLEIAGALPELKAGALRLGDAEMAPPSDDRVFISRPQIVVIYTAVKRGAEVVHHVSVSRRGDRTANAIGSMFTRFVATQLGLPVARMRFEGKPGGTHHGEVVLSAAEHDAYVAAPIPKVSPEGIASFRRAWLAQRRSA
jgi:hypothetical protein